MAKQQLMGGALATSWLLTLSPVAAQSPSDAEKIERLQRQAKQLQKQLHQQSDLMQKQIEALQEEIAQTRKKSARKEADQARTVEGDQPDSATHPRETFTAATYPAEPAARLERKLPKWGDEEEFRAAGPETTATSEIGRVQFPDGRPTITSVDGRMSLALGTFVDFDVGGYFQNRHEGVFEPPGARELNNGENLRRGRIYVVGTYGDWTVRITPEFGGSPDGSPSLYEANLNYTIKPITFTIGYFKPYDTLAQSQFPGNALFMEEPSIAAIAGDVADGIQRATAGLKASTDDYFAAAYLTGATYGSQDPVLLDRQQTGSSLRLATRPFRGEDWNLHIGFSGSKVFNFNKSDFQPGGTVEGIRLSDQPELRIDFNRLIDTGFIPAKTADTWGFELAANWRNFLIEGEYSRIDVNPLLGTTLSFDGWYVEGSWVMTGESRPYLASSAAYGRPTPAHPFNLSPDGGRGAWELAGRYSVTDLNSGPVFGGRQEVTSAALSWYPDAHVRFILQGSHVDVDRLDPTGKIQVGQSFWDLALRSQIAY